jgi:hypothetical protein
LNGKAALPFRILSNYETTGLMGESEEIGQVSRWFHLINIEILKL